MAKSIVLGILMETLGEYIDISREKLKMAVWSGEIELRDLTLKSSALSSLDLPLCVLRGSIKSLKITIPWKNLGKSPTLIQLNGLFASVGPSDDTSFTPDDLRRHSSELKRRILERAERIAYAYVSSELKKKELNRTAASASNKKKAKNASWITSLGVSYAQNVLAKILANIELKLLNIHIRYEDCVVIPGYCISAGITISEIFVVTTDENWVESTISSKPSIMRRSNGIANGSIMHKTATLRNLTVYWNTDLKMSLMDSLHGSASDARWISAMESLIYDDKNKMESSGVQYIFLPPNDINIRVAHNEEHFFQTSLTTDSDITTNTTDLKKKNIDKLICNPQYEKSCHSFACVDKSGNKGNDNTTSIRGSGSGRNNESSEESYDASDDIKLPCLADVSLDMGQLQLAINRKQLHQVRI